MVRPIESRLMTRPPPRLARAAILAILATACLVISPYAIRAGDSLYGRVTGVRRADLVTFDYGAGTYQIRLAGVVVPQERAAVQVATQFVSDMLLNKNARLRFGGRTPQGEMVGKIFTDDPEIGIRDVAVEMVRAGLARRDLRYTGYRYGEMTTAEEEAQSARRGIWRSGNP